MAEEWYDVSSSEEECLVYDGLLKRRKQQQEEGNQPDPNEQQQQQQEQDPAGPSGAPKSSTIAMDSPGEESQDLGFFKVWLLVSQLLGVICIALVSAWIGKYLGGFAWESDPNKQFNYHPFFMILGMVFLYGDALLVFRVFRNQRKKSLKLLHLGLHTTVFVMAIVALQAVFDFHNRKGFPNLYSLHSWIGLTAVILFAMQYFCGIVAFLYPGLTKIWRAKYLPLHIFFGLGIFLIGVTACLTGITEKLLFSLPNGKYSELPAPGVIGNLLAYCLVLFAILVAYMVVTPLFRRRALPEEVQLQLETHSPTN